ncbi:M48 family metalloprotease [Thermococcus argininiproducens]|uniref:M48 family metalloprotease n=1 Tax=Thermococcus argininiproducens TaxID=2866384 RepID=A0A9E7M994_9EURY|nr:M48 family metalloprotease [Thermococcus argininiproducens]USG99714.1 M48 family metalloprotease [Thermococcus argininiproducens]
MLKLIFLAQLLITLLYLGRIGLAVTLLTIFILVGLYFWTIRRSLQRDQRLLSFEDMPWLYDGIMRMANKAGIAPPEIYILDDYIPNAYSFGNSIVLSLGLFEVLDEEEILAVAAHEIGHIKNSDTLMFPLISYLRYLMLSLVLLNTVFSKSLLVSVVSILLYIAYEVERSRHLRKREFKADETALRLVSKPLALKEALEELKYYEDLRTTVKDPVLPSIEPSIERKSQKPFFTTHPSYDERIWRIMAEVDAMTLRERIFN